MHMRKTNVYKKVLSLVLIGGLTFSQISFGFGETKPQGAEIVSFSLLDTASDLVGSDFFKPEGYKDGHFQVKLKLEKKTVIRSVVLRTTNEYGKDASKGVWRTNRLTAGWLLGIVQNKTVKTETGTSVESEIINPGFRDDVNEPVGEFQGELVLDLYASNNGHNGSITESQYFVLEIETPEGTISSKPIKYKKPMIAEGSSNAPATPSPSTPSPSTPTPPSNPGTPTPGSGPAVPPPSQPTTPPPAEGPKIHVYIKGQKIEFNEAQPISKDGSTLVPFRKLFESLGFTVTWKEDGGIQQAIGTKDGLTIELTINSSTAKVNGQEAALNVPAQIIAGHTMIPLRFVAETSGYDVSYSSADGIATIRIEEATQAPGAPQPTTPEPTTPEPTTPEPTTPEPTTPQPTTPKPTTPAPPQDMTVEPYVMKGYVRDSEGNPIAGAKVYADNTFLIDSNILGVTDETGYYRLELPQVATTWRMGVNFTKVIGKNSFSFNLFADGDTPFAGNIGAIRNVTWQNNYGYVYINPLYISFKEDQPEFQYEDVELMLIPLDGSSSKPIVKHLYQVNDANGVDQLPLGRYKASVRWLPPGHDPIPMLIRVNGKGSYAESVEFEFGGQRNVPDIVNFRKELEIRVP